MKRSHIVKMFALPLLFVAFVGADDCSGGQDFRDRDRDIVNDQQAHYASTQPIPFFDYSMPRDVLIQIYRAIIAGNRNTYTIVESITGETKWECPSIGYPIPADTQLTNPLKTAYHYHDSAVIEQPEPNGLFSSKNTDGTWILCVDINGKPVPIYTEQKATAFPFAVKKSGEQWVRADQEPASTTIDLSAVK